jgi:hypothetical protein
MAPTNKSLAQKNKRAATVLDTSTRMSSPDPKLRQTAKLNALREALVEAGLRTLDAQAAALGLGRSTTWVILRGQHKSSGLSVRTINRMLAADLPPSVRAVILDYIGEKLAGAYGDKQYRLKVFASRLAA